MKRQHVLIPPYIFLLLVMFILPFFSTEGYSLLEHTTSQLGAQNTPNAWVMNLSFSLLGFACLYESFFYLKKYRFQQAILIIFGLSLIFTAVFRHAPINELQMYSKGEDRLHSFFASAVGFSFTVFSFSVTFIEKTKKRQFFAFSVGIIAVVLSVLMLKVTAFSGIWQRLIFITTFAWLNYFLKDQAAVG